MRALSHKMDLEANDSGILGFVELGVFYCTEVRCDSDANGVLKLS